MPPRRKFDGVDFTQHPLQKFNPGSEEVLGRGFRCVRPEFVTYFKQGKIGREVLASTCQCWVLMCPDGLAGYYATSGQANLGRTYINRRGGLMWSSVSGHEAKVG